MDCFSNAAVFVLCRKLCLFSNVVAFVVYKLNINSGTTAFVLCDKFYSFLNAAV